MPKKYETNAAICSMHVGEHTQKQAKYIANWMTKHIENKTSPTQFNEFWRKYEDDEELPNSALLGKGKLIERLGELDFTETDFPEFYRTAVIQNAEKFTTFDNNAYIDIVAIRGKPTKKDIAICVLGKENVED